MKHCSKKYFNMVEIVLALAVVSVAIVSLMGMLPVALRASKNSVADNSVASVVEIMKSFIDIEYKGNNFTVFQGKFKKDLSVPEENSETKLTFSSSDKAFPENPDDLEKYAFKITYKDSADGTYRVELFSGEFESGKFAVTDFDADVRVWYTDLDGELYIPVKTDDIDNNIYKKGSTQAVPISHACTFNILVSWPAETSFKNQEHRLYKFDYFKRAD